MFALFHGWERITQVPRYTSIHIRDHIRHVQTLRIPHSTRSGSTRAHPIVPIPTSAPSLRWGSTHPPHQSASWQVGKESHPGHPNGQKCWAMNLRMFERKKERKKERVTWWQDRPNPPSVLDPSCDTSRIGAAAGSIDARQHPWSTKDIPKFNSEVPVRPVRPVPSAIHNNLRLTPYIVSHLCESMIQRVLQYTVLHTKTNLIVGFCSHCFYLYN